MRQVTIYHKQQETKIIILSKETTQRIISSQVRNENMSGLLTCFRAGEHGISSPILFIPALIFFFLCLSTRQGGKSIYQTLWYQCQSLLFSLGKEILGKEIPNKILSNSIYWRQITTIRFLRMSYFKSSIIGTDKSNTSINILKCDL